MASTSHPPSYGSTSSNPRTLSDSSNSSTSPPDRTGIQPSCVTNPHQKTTTPYRPEYQENDAPWQVHRAYTTDVIRHVESLLKSHPVLQKVVERHPDFARRIVITIDKEITFEAPNDPHQDWIHYAERLFNDIAATASTHPLVAYAFSLQYLPHYDIHPALSPLCRELHTCLVSWVHDPLKLLPRMLAWIHFPKRRLSAKEFQQAMMYSLNVDPPKKGLEPSFRDLNSAGGGFIQFSENEETIMVPKGLEDSIRDYFNRLGGGRYHIYMGLVCLAYIHHAVGFNEPCRDNDSLNQRLRQNPLLPYAVENWHYHIPPSLYYMEKPAWYLHGDQIIRSMMQIQGKLQVQRLPDRNITQDPSQWYYWNTTRLSYAASIGSYALVEALLNRYCHANDNVGLQPPLVSAALNGHLDIVNLLLSHGVNVNVCDFADRRALHVAVFEGHNAIVDRLLSAQADVNCRTKDGMTPLMAAICNGNLAIAGRLLQFRAKVYPESCDGQTALSYALMKPEFWQLALSMFTIGETQEIWHSSPKADIALYETISEIKDAGFQTRIITHLRQIDSILFIRGSIPDRLNWNGSFLRTLLYPTEAMAVTSNAIKEKRRAEGMISPLSNNFRRRYMLDSPIGQGAFSSAWKAIDLVTGRLVAVKFMMNPKDSGSREQCSQ